MRDDLRRVVLLHDLVVAVVIGRPEQFAGDAALVDHLEIALGRLDLDLGAVEELPECFVQHMADRGLLGLERASRPARRCKDGSAAGAAPSGASAGLRGHDDDEAVVLADDRAGDLEQLDRAAGGADRLGQGVETGVLGIKGHREIRAVVGSALDQLVPAGNRPPRA